MGREIGYVSVGAAILLYGVFAFPSKATVTGDGVIYSLYTCLGIFLVGALQHMIQCATSCANFTPLASLGGALWATSNLLTIPCCRLLGVGRTMIIWGCSEMLTGWATARFGLFGLKKQPVASDVMNYCGVVAGVLSIAILAYAAPSEEDAEESPDGDGDGEEDIHEPLNRDTKVSPSDYDLYGYGSHLMGKLSSSQKYSVGIACSVFAGVLSGSMFTPVQYVVDHVGSFPDASTRLSDHLFAHFTGILFAGLCYYVIYVFATRGKPWSTPEVGLPALTCGVLWGAAAIAWFAANENLSLVIAFPLVTLGPGLVSMVIGAVFFGELKDFRQATLLFFATLMFGVAATLIALSGAGGD
jgi:glucose uptake protein GlcU